MTLEIHFVLLKPSRTIINRKQNRPDSFSAGTLHNVSCPKIAPSPEGRPVKSGDKK